MRIPAIGIAAVSIVGSAHAGTLDGVLMRQKKALWESTRATGDKALPCVTDPVKAGAQKQALESKKQLGCKAGENPGLQAEWAR